MSKAFKRLFRFFLISFFLIFTALSILTVLLVDGQSNIGAVGSLDIASANKAKQTAKRLFQTLKTSRKTMVKVSAHTPVSSISVTKEEARSLAMLAHKVMPKIKLASYFIDGEVQVLGSYQLPLGNFHINVAVELLSSTQGLKLGNIQVGSLAISESTFWRIAQTLLDWKIEEGFTQMLKSLVQSVDANRHALTVNYQLPPSTVMQGSGALAKLFKLRDNLAIYGKAEDVAHYYQKLVEVTARYPSTSLADYLSVSLTAAFAKKALDGNVSAKTENYYALMALVLYLGHDRFELLVGNVSQLTPIQRSQRNKLRNSVKLNDRVDLQKHFIYSVALQLFSNVDASDALGEFKELLDANNGGSGFSFADLLADRVGTRFAQLATSSDSEASKLQERMMGAVHERLFMPEHIDLPEGISQSVFEANYADTQSDAYKAMIQDIDQRLLSVPIYQN